MSCPFRDCEGYNEIDCYMSNEYHVQCPLIDLCNGEENIVGIINDFVYKALETEREARELHNK